MKELLQGRFMGHPLHPLLVHFPIALFLLSLLLDAVALLIDARPVWVQAAFWSLAIGVGMALLAAVPGFVDYFDIRRDHPARRLASTHMTLNLTAVGLYAASLGFRAATLGESQTPWVPFGLSLAAFGLICYSGYLGGKMIYEDGVAVGRHRRRTPTPKETLRATKFDERWFTVCPAEQLAEGASVRVQVAERIVVVAKHDRQLYAFQEFCTHRFGPLSEGTFHDGLVECPWHRSCFELRAGKVTQGPAKLEIKTYPVEIKNNLIAIRLPENEKR